MAKIEERNMNTINEARFTLEEVGKLVGSSVASALREHDQSYGYYDSDDQNGEVTNGRRNLRRNKDGSIDKRQFNNGQGDNRDNNENNDVRE